MASEERENLIPIPPEYPAGKYELLFDLLEGSSNIDYNVCVETIFTVYQRKTASGVGNLKDCLQSGREMVVAGYLLYMKLRPLTSSLNKPAAGTQWTSEYLRYSTHITPTANSVIFRKHRVGLTGRRVYPDPRVIRIMLGLKCSLE